MNTRPPALVSSAQRALRRLLSAAFDDPERAGAAVSRALAIAKRDSLPEDTPEILEFARDYVLPVVSDDLGPRLAAALIHDFEEELDADRVTQPPPEPTPLPSSAYRTPPRGGPAPAIARDDGGARERAVKAPSVGQIAVAQPASPAASRAKVRASVLLVDGDRFGRAPLARALVSGGCDVSAVDAEPDVNVALRGTEPIDIVMIDAEHPAFDSILRTIAEARPNAAVIARADRVASANSKLLASGLREFGVRPKSALPRELLELIARLTS